MSIMKTFLVIEDEKFINQYISNSLEANGYKAYSALTGKEGLSQITSLCPDFIVLDLGLPDIDGLTIIEQTRSWSNIPIIIVSARDNEIDKVTALDMGADDYVTKPFNTNELMARVRTALRHKYNAIGITDYVHKELSISFEKHLTFINGKPLHLTQIQYKILSFLAENHGKVVTYNTLMEHVWGPYVDNNNRILRVNMAHIRRKIEPNPSEPIHVITEVGIGYRMAESEQQ